MGVSEAGVVVLNYGDERHEAKLRATAQERAQGILRGMGEAQYPWHTHVRLRNALATAVDLRWGWGVVQDRTQGPVRRRILRIEGPKGGVLYARQKPYARRPNNEPMYRRGRWETTTYATDTTF